jgi:hypothetical protein
MTIEDRLPHLTDSELGNLHDNAVRLSRSGEGAMKAEAERILPMIDAEVENRAKAHAAELATRRASRRKAAPKARAAPRAQTRTKAPAKARASARRSK